MQAFVDLNLVELLFSCCRDTIRNMFRWTAIDQSTHQPKMVSICVEWPSRDKADMFDQAINQAITHLGKVEVSHRGQMPTYGAGDALLPKPKVRNHGQDLVVQK